MHLITWFSFLIALAILDLVVPYKFQDCSMPVCGSGGSGAIAIFSGDCIESFCRFGRRDIAVNNSLLIQQQQFLCILQNYNIIKFLLRVFG